MADWKEDYLDVLLVPMGLIILLGYQVFFYYRLKRNPLQTVVGLNHAGRSMWVHAVMKDNEKKNILAVQTLRNSIMASTLLATVCILLSCSLAAFVSSSYGIKPPLMHALLGSHGAYSVSIKFTALLLCLFFCFLCYIQSIRYSNHVGYLINVPSTQHSEALKITPHYVSAVLAQSSNFYTIGTRGFYFAFPLMLWVFGPIPLFVSCLLLVPLLYRLDMVPQGQVAPIMVDFASHV